MGIAMDQFVEWAFKHVIGKVGSIPENDVALLHAENYTEKEYLDFVEIAVNDETSYNRSSYYNFMLNLFVEADKSCSGRVNRAQFDVLLNRAAKVPRHFGLAPDVVDTATRDKMFDAMQLRRGDKRTGFVTSVCSTSGTSSTPLRRFVPTERASKLELSKHASVDAMSCYLVPELRGQIF